MAHGQRFAALRARLVRRRGAIRHRTLRSSALALAVLATLSAQALSESGESQTDKRMNDAAGTMSSVPRMGALTDPQRKQLVEFVAGNVAFVLTHELGHVVVSEMGIPVLGRLEDAADSFAIVAMLDMGTDMSLRTLTEATWGWYLSSRRDAAEGMKEQYYAAHSLSAQRAYQIVCLMVGSDPKRFGALAERAKMPPQRRSSCLGDFSNASWSWNKVLAPNLRGADDPQTEIGVKYGPNTEALAVYEQALRQTRLLESVAARASRKYKWRAPFQIEARSCGEPNAFWHLPSRTLVLCYELAADFAQLYRQYGVTSTPLSVVK